MYFVLICVGAHNDRPIAIVRSGERRSKRIRDEWSPIRVWKRWMHWKGTRFIRISISGLRHYHRGPRHQLPTALYRLMPLWLSKIGFASDNIRNREEDDWQNSRGYQEKRNSFLSSIRKYSRMCWTFFVFSSVPYFVNWLFEVILLSILGYLAWFKVA